MKENEIRSVNSNKIKVSAANDEEVGLENRHFDGTDDENKEVLLLALSETDNSSEQNIFSSHAALTSSSETTTRRKHLSLPVLILYGLNGAILSLPSTALLYIVNTRVAVPIQYLSIYGAIAFLPSSLKPIYAFFTNCLVSAFPTTSRRAHVVLMSVLLLLQGLVIVATDWIPKQQEGMILCFVLAFLREATNAWPELLLGVCLVQEAARHATTTTTLLPESSDPSTDIDDEDDNSTDSTLSSSFDKMAAVFQSQAATARNVGSLLANIAGLLFFASLHHQQQETKALINDSTVSQLLYATGMLSFVGSIVCCVGFRSNNDVNASNNSCGDYGFISSCLRENVDNNKNDNNRIYMPIRDGDDDDATLPTEKESEQNVRTSAVPAACISNQQDDENENESNNHSHWFGDGLTKRFSWMRNVLLIVLLQVLIIVLSLRGTLRAGLTTTSIVLIGIISFVVVFILVSGGKTASQSRAYRVGIYLVMKNAIPSIQYTMTNYLYSQLSSSSSQSGIPPAVLWQTLSLMGMAVTTFSSWSYGRVLATTFSVTRVIIGTTLLASVVGLLNLGVVMVATRHPTAMELFGIAVLTSLFTTFADEWYFLPSVVLATTAIDLDLQQEQRHHEEEEENTASRHRPQDIDMMPTSYQKCIKTPCRCSYTSLDTDQTGSIALRYGALLSCIDFGDQIASWLTVPLIAALGISRENDWANMDKFIILVSSLTILSLVLVPLIRK